jgi:DNA repair exonuclease SbcCD ATPase subunit
LAKLQASRELKVARKAALEAELRSLSAEIEIDDKKIAELPGLIEKTQEEAISAIAKVNQCDAELTTLSSAQKDYQERMESFRQTTSNVRSVIAKHLNIYTLQSMCNRIGRSCNICSCNLISLFFCTSLNATLIDPFGKEVPIPEWHFDSFQPSQSTEYDSA